MRNKILTIALIIIIISAGFIAYSSSLKGDFIWDDEYLVKENAYIKNWAHINKIVSGKMSTKNVTSAFRFYRPLQLLTYSIDYSIWKMNSLGYHVTNVLLHALAGVALFWLINLMLGSCLIAFLTALLFVVNPVNTEAVSYISGRSDPLSAFLLFLSFIFYIKGTRGYSKIYYFLMLLSFVGALLSREASVVFMLIIPLYCFVFSERIKKSYFLSIVGMTFVYGVVRFTILKNILSNSIINTTFFQRLPGVFVSIVNYLKLLFVPYPLHMEYGKKLFAFNDIKAIIGVVVVIVLITGAFIIRKKNKIVSFSILWFFITFIPISNLYGINAYMAEHWLYLPSIGFLLIIAYYIKRLIDVDKYKVMAIILITALIASYSVMTFKQNYYWKDSVSLYKRTLQFAPNSFRVYNNLGMSYRNRGDLKEAIAPLKKALMINPNYAEAYINLGNTYRDLGKRKEAASFYRKVIKLKPNYGEAYNNLAIEYSATGRNMEAIKLYQKAIELNPDYSEAYYNLGISQKQNGVPTEAIESYKKAININPSFAEAYNNLGILYRAMGRQKEAIDAYKKAIRLKPRYADAYNNLAVEYKSLNRDAEAIQMYKKAIEVKPDYAVAFNNLGIVYGTKGEYEDAIKCYKKAVEINSELSSAYYNLSVIYYKQNKLDLSKKYCKLAVKQGYPVSKKLLRILGL